MKIHYDHTRHGWLIESRALAWLCDLISRRARLWMFVIGYVACLLALAYGLVRWTSQVD